jgi:hypothetical protein
MNSEKKKLNSLNDCGRKEDLMTYLYGEADTSQRGTFERHLDDCDACRNELTAFGRVRDDLGAWQLGLAPRAGVVLPRNRLDLLRELIGMFPVWVRGAAMAGAVAAMLLVTLSIAGTRISLKDGDFAINFGRTGNPVTGAPEVSSKEIERMVQNAVAGEREGMERRFSAQLASLKDQLNADHQAQLRAAKAENQARLKALQAGMQQELRRYNRQNTSIRSFFARDDSTDPWGDGR